jgi:hypothetical protein
LDGNVDQVQSVGSQPGPVTASVGASQIALADEPRPLAEPYVCVAVHR